MDGSDLNGAICKRICCCIVDAALLLIKGAAITPVAVFVVEEGADLTAGDKLQIAYGVDYQGTRFVGDGYHCIDIDVSCLI